MRQPNGCGNVINDEIFNLHLGSSVSPRFSIPSAGRHQPHPLIPSVHTINQEETKRPEKR